MKPTPIEWAKRCVESHGLEHALDVAKKCFHITPLDPFWINALGFLRKIPKP